MSYLGLRVLKLAGSCKGDSSEDRTRISGIRQSSAHHVITTLQWWATLDVVLQDFSFLIDTAADALHYPMHTMRHTSLRMLHTCSQWLQQGGVQSIAIQDFLLCDLSHLPHKGIVQVLEHWSHSSL